MLLSKMKEKQTATQASNNPRGILLPLVTSKPTLISRYVLAAYQFTLNQIQAFGKGASFGWTPCGVVHAATTKRLAKLVRTFQEQDWEADIVQRIGRDEATRRSGVPLNASCFWYPRGGMLIPQRFTQAFLQKPRIRVLLNHQVASLRRRGSQWELLDLRGHTLISGDAVILANNNEITHFAESRWLPLQRVRGQLLHLPSSWLQTPPQTILCHEGFITPCVEGTHILGATWNLTDPSSQLNPEDQAKILEKAGAILVFSKHANPPLRGRVAFRSQSPDHLPVAGPLPNCAAFADTYADLHHGRPRATYPPAEYLPHLWVSGGHGSRGMTSAPLAAELIAALAFGEPLPLPQDLVEALHPARFLIRDLKKKPQDRSILGS